MKKAPKIFLALLLVSALVVALAGGYIKYGILEPLGIHREESLIAMPFVYLTDSGLRFMVETKKNPVPTEASETVSLTEVVLEITVPETAASEPPAATETAPTEPAYVQLEESWFDDALFIGDSRIVGLHNYHRLGKCEFFTTIGMNIYNVMEVWSSDLEFDGTQLEPLLQERSYGKIFIGIGLNEIHYEYDYTMAGFQQLIDMIQKHQPDVPIVLMSIMTVSEDKAKEAEYFSPENIYRVNEGIASFADGESIFYIDVNEWIADENGYLPKDQTSDGVHLYGTGYEEMAKWLVDICGYLPIA